MDIGSDGHDCECWECLGREEGQQVRLKQEIDGLQAEQFLPRQKTVRAETIKSRIEEGGWACPEKR